MSESNIKKKELAMDENDVIVQRDLSDKSLLARTGTGATNDEQSEVRRQKITDYVGESLKKSDLLEANLGAVNGDLMSLASRFRGALEEVLERSPESLAEMAEFMPTIDVYLRVTKQVERYSQLALKLKRENGEH
jgi:hypothetical protein